MSKKEYRSMQGRVVDLDAMRAKNETVVAVSNENLNARGDRIKGGKIIQRREEVVSEYYESNPNAQPRSNPVEEATEQMDPIIHTPPVSRDHKPEKKSVKSDPVIETDTSEASE